MGDGQSAPVTGVSPMWSLSGDSATFAAVTTAKLDTNATNYVALHHPTGWEIVGVLKTAHMPFSTIQTY